MGADDLAVAIPVRRILVAWIARVIEAAAVREPGHARVLAPLQRVAQIPPGVDIAHPQGLLVASGFRDEIGNPDAAPVGIGAGDRDGAVVRQRRGIDQRAARAGEMILDTVAALVGEAVIEEREVTRAVLRRDAGSRIVEQQIEELAGLLAGRRGKIGTGALVLRRDPGLDVGALHVLERPERVRHRNAVHQIGRLVARRGRKAGRPGVSTGACAIAGRAAASTPVAMPPTTKARRVAPNSHSLLTLIGVCSRSCLIGS